MTLQEAIKSSGFKSEHQKAALNIMYVAYRVKTFISQHLKQFDLTPEQYNVLRILKGKYPDEMCVKDIADRLIERSSNVPRIIDRLVIKKLVRRIQSGSDRRETIIQITQAGINLLIAADPTVDDANKDLTEMNNTDLKTLNELLDRYLKD